MGPISKQAATTIYGFSLVAAVPLVTIVARIVSVIVRTVVVRAVVERIASLIIATAVTITVVRCAYIARSIIGGGRGCSCDDSTNTHGKASVRGVDRLLEHSQSSPSRLPWEAGHRLTPPCANEPSRSGERMQPQRINEC